MKSIKYVPCALLAAALALFSCAKENALETRRTESAVNVPEGWSLRTFAASSAETKTSLGEGGKVSWVEGDEVKLCWWDPATDTSGFATMSAQSAGPSTTFVAVVPDGITDFWAVYPAKLIVEVSKNREAGATDPYVVHVTFPGTCDGSFAGANYCAAKSETVSGKTSFSFKNICSIFRLQAGMRWSSLKQVLMRNGNTDSSAPYRLYGIVALDFASDGSVTTTYVSGGSGTLRATNLTTSAQDWVYLPVIPGCAIDGLLIKLYDQDGSSIPGAWSSKPHYTTKASTLYNLGVAEDKIVYDYYFSPSGSTDAAMTEADPGNFTAFKNLINPDQQTITNGYRLDGSTFHFAGGKYDIPAAINFDFNTDALPDLIFEGAADGTTVFDGGGPDAGEHNLFTIADKRSVGLLFRNITFQNIYGKGGVFTCRDAGASLAFEKCKFLDNESTGHAGAVLAVAGTFSFTDCVFTNNVAKSTSRAGAIYNTSAKMDIVRCTFTENNGGTYGGAIYMGNAAGKLTISHCSFVDNKVANYGGALYLQSQEVRMNDCTFSGNKQQTATVNANYGGGAIYIAKETKLYADHCDFTSNSSYRGGAVFVAKSATTYPGRSYFNSCRFNENSTSNFGPGFFCLDYGVVALNNCTLYGNTSSYSDKSPLSVATRLLVNTTVIGELTGASHSMVRVVTNAGGADLNCIFLPTTGTGHGLYVASSDMNGGYSLGNNLMKSYGAASGSSYTPHETDLTGISLSDLGEGVYSGGFYTWNGSVTGQTLPTALTPAQMAEKIRSVTTALGSGDDAYQLGPDFCDWLTNDCIRDGHNALEVDGRGTVRSGGYWPGSYQN